MGAQYWNQPLLVLKEDGPALTAAAAASMLPGSAKFALPSLYWAIAKTWHLRASGRISTVITTPGTARVDVRIGGVVVFDSLAIVLDTAAAHTNVGWMLDLFLTCRSIGTSTSTQLFGQGTFASEVVAGFAGSAPKGVTSAILPWNSAPTLGTGFDNSLSNIFDVFFTQTVATGSFTLHQMIVEEMN